MPQSPTDRKRGVASLEGKLTMKTGEISTKSSNRGLMQSWTNVVMRHASLIDESPQLSDIFMRSNKRRVLARVT